MNPLTTYELDAIAGGWRAPDEPEISWLTFWLLERDAILLRVPS